MTFTYTPSTPTDITRVRYNIRDTDSTAAMFSDEEITFRIAEVGDWKHAVIDMLTGKIMELSNIPNFSAGWLRVDQTTARQQLERLLAMKRQEFGISLITASVTYIYRPDNTDFDSAPTFDSPADDDTPNDGDDDDD